MIKRIVYSILIIITMCLPVNANILPTSTSDIIPEAIGLYQIPQHIVLRQKPDIKSDIIYEAKWDYKSFNSIKGNSDKVFTVFIQEKELAYMQVTDFSEDWIEVIYNRNSLKKGWLQYEEIRFMSWRNFYNAYGRKYGLKIFSDAPIEIKHLHSSTDENSQRLQSIKKPQKIKFTVVKGNWALITAIEDNVGKTGYLRWRSDDGVIYAFPAIK